MKNILYLFAFIPLVCLGQNPGDCENISSALVDLALCDDDNDGIAVFDLTSINSYILNGQDPSNYNISFHESQAGAENNTNPISSPYTNSTPNLQSIYTRTTDIDNTCLSISSFNIIVDPLPFLVLPTPLEVCDDGTPDGLTQLDLSIKDEEIRGGNSNYSISYYSTQSDADSGTSPLTNPYTNLSNPQTIYARGEDTINGCYAITAFDLVVTDCTVSSPVCGDTIFDSGGDTGDYGNNELTNVTVYPETTGDLVTFTFLSFDIESGWDLLTVYDGPDVSSTVLGAFSGDTIPDPITSSHPTGALTFVFESDGSFVSSGYEIVISCAAPTVGIIQVNAFVDANINNVYDNDEFSFSSGYFIYELNGDGIINNISSSTGNFQIISENETDFYNISFNLHDEYVDCYDITQISFDNISVATGSTISIEFPVVEEQICEDLAVYLINYSTPPRPGFSHYNYLVLENLGFTSISSGTVEFTHDPLLIYNSVTSVNPNYTIINTATGFTVDFLNLQPGNVEYIEVSLTSPTNLELGDITTNTATYSTNSNDLVSSNNFSTLSELVVGSWDPNDKMESRGPRILYDDFVNSDNWLYYTVRFQNLGTFPATFVRIEDELDSQLDETSFQMLQSSHDYVVKRTLSSLEWFFDDINLPAEQDDAQGSNGFIYFRIKPNIGYAKGDVIPNTAEIYFDFNAPVITNRFETEFIEDILSLSEFDISGFNMYPNPTNDILNIKLNNINKANLSICDIRGKLILEQTIFEERNLELNVLELQSGIYFVKINTPHTKIVKKLIIE